MAELPGWDRARLTLAHPADVAAARWVVYARALAPMATDDFEGPKRHIEIMGMKDGPRRRAAEDEERRQAIRKLNRALNQQGELRTLLMLDDQPGEVSARND